MSTSGALDRSTLDQKDRAELQTIAQAMGAKPLSRARKGDIVDMILEMAGGSDKPARGGKKQSNKADGNDKSAQNDGSDGADGSDEADASESAGRNGSDTKTDDNSDTKPDDKAADNSGDMKSGDRNESRDNDRGARNRDGGNRDGGKGDGGNRDASNREGGNREGGNRDASNRDASNRDGGNREGGNRDGGNREGGNRDGGNRDGGSNRSRNRNRNDRNKNRNANDRQRGGGGGGSGGGGGGGGGNNNDSQPEAGNRKRRRRGRGGQDVPNEEVAPWDGEPVAMEGYVDVRDEGYGFVRVHGIKPSDSDAYVTVKMIRELGLRRGDYITGTCRPANRNEKNPSTLSIDKINDADPKGAKDRPKFEDLTPLFPDEKMSLERVDDPDNMTCRIIDLISPIGKGQRGLIVSPPKAGKTTIMKEIARSIEINNPEVKLFVLLVDERPEEVTDMRRWLVRGEVIGSTFDRPSDEHTAVAEIVIERAKRMVEQGDDVVIMLDGITRLSRAYNLAAPATGRIMSGGVDSGALYPPKRFFGAARNVEEGGSLTILATALVETGSKMDEVIFEEFKGTGNMELRLDRKTAERRVYPAIDVDASSTRHEELLFDRKQLNQVWKLRRVLSGMANDDDRGGRGNAAGLELLIDRLKTFPDNNAFLEEVARGPVG